MFAKHPDARAVDRQHHQADDRAARRSSGARPSDVFTAPGLRRAARPSRRSTCAPGERMRVHDLLEALLLESANDAAVTLAEGVSGSRAAFVEADERARAASSGLDAHELRQPDRARRPGQLLLGPRPRRRSPRVLMRNRASPGSSTCRRPSSSRARTARGREPQRPGRGLALGRRRQDRAHAAGRLRARRRGARAERRAGDQRGAGRAERGRARRRHARAAALGRRPVPARARARRAPAAGRAPTIEYRDEQRAARAAPRARSSPCATGERVRRRVRRARRGRGPARRAGARVGTVTVLRRRRGRCGAWRWSPRPRSRGRGRCGCSLRWLGVPLTLLARRSPSSDRRRGSLAHAGSRVRHADSSPMIITVTLNAAIDKTLAVPNFRLGRRHRAVEQTAMAGGKGVNVARALKALGQPVIATGVAGGPTGTRIIEHLTEEAHPQRLRAHPRGVAHVDRRRRPHLGRADRDQRARPARVRGRARAVRGQAALPGQGRRGLRVLRQPAARGRRRPLRAAGRGDAAPRRDHACSTPRASRCGSPRARARRRDARTSSRPRSSSATSSPTRTTAARGVGEMVELGAREAIMTLPDGCLALLGATARRPRLYRATLEPLEPVSSVGSGDAFLAGYVAARYGGRAPEDCLRFAVACGAESTQHFGAGVRRASARSSACVRRRCEWRRSADARSRATTWRAARPLLGSAVRPPLEPRIRQWKLRSGGARRAAAHTASMTSRSCPRGARATPTTSTSPGCSAPTASSCPLLASAMDGVVSPETAGIIGKLGGLGVLNLEGIWTRYEDAERAARADRAAAQGAAPPRRCSASTRSRSRTS